MSDLEATRRKLDEANSEIRQLLQQRKDLRKERDRAFEDGARSMQERAAQVAYKGVFGTELADSISALPLLPDSDAGPPPAEDFDAGWAAGHAHASADADRLAELEKQVADLSALVHGHGEDIGQAQAAIRGLTSGRTAPRRYNAWTDG